MGFDNECILNIQSLAGEYFCPVCRTLVYPHEALQTQCTHLYCKPCLSYVVSSTQACPYDGYLVTEASSKPLMESNKALAETIGKTTVHCLYHRSGCVWQGPLSECTTHCSGCAFGNSPVVCNRCGIQIVHRQVQEHAQTCNVNGTSTQPQQGTETAQDVAASGGAVSTDQSKLANQAAAAVPASQPQAPSAAQNVNQPATANPAPQAMPAPDQQYYQQYQQYYQQYPGYDPYQQGYQQYYPYQQPPAQQVQQPPLQVQAQSQPQSQPQLQQQAQALMPQVQPQSQGQGQPQPQAQPQVPSNGPPQPVYLQAPVVGSSQSQSSQQPVQPLGHGHMPPQSYSQVQPHPVQTHAQPPHVQVPQYQPPHPQMHHPQPPQLQPYPQTQPQPYPQPHSHFQPQPINPQHPPVQSVAGHPSYPPQIHQQIQHAPPQQHPMQVQPQPSGSLLPAQFPPPPSQMRPPHPPHMLPPQQRPVMHQVQQAMPPQYMQQPPQAFPGQVPGQSHHAGPFAQQQHPQVRPQGPPQPMQQPPLGYVQPQQGNALPPHGVPPHPSQNYAGRPPMLNQGGQPQQFTPHAKPPQFGPTNQMHIYPEQQNNQYASPSVANDQTFEIKVEQQEEKSPSLKKSEPVANDFGANFNEVKPEAGLNDECKPEVDQIKDVALTKDAVSELHQSQGVPDDSATTQKVKEESKDGGLDHHPGAKSSQNKADDVAVAPMDSAKHGEANVNFQADNGPVADRSFSQSQSTPQGPIGDASGGFASKGTEESSHPPGPYGLPGQQQRSVASHTEPTVGPPPSHLRPPGPGYFQPPGPNQPPPFLPEFPSGGPPPNSFGNRGFEPQSGGHGRFSRMSQVDPLGLPLPHGPDGQTGPRHPGSMESDMYQNQRLPHFDSRRPDSHLPGNLDRGPYGPPYGVESNSMRMNGGPPPGHDSSSAPGFRDEKFRTPDIFPMPPTRHLEGTFKQFSGPPHLGSDDSPKYGNHSSRPMSGYGMDGPSRFLDKDPHGYGYHSTASMHDDNRGRFDDNRHNPEFHGPMHGFGRHHMDRLPPTSPGNPSRSFGGPHSIDVDGREMERHPFGERYPIGPPGHMHRGEFDGPGKPRSVEAYGPRNLSGRGEPGFGSFHDYGRSGESNGPGPGGFSHHPPFGESFGTKSTRPHLGEPGFRSSYSRQGFPSDGGFYAGGSDSFDPLRKRKTFSMGWCRICKVDCESVEGLDMHGQTREHQRMAMDMVISIKKKNAKKQKTSNDREEGSKFRNSEIHARANMP